jgi:hypothetical protein
VACRTRYGDSPRRTMAYPIRKLGTPGHVLPAGSTPYGAGYIGYALSTGMKGGVPEKAAFSDVNKYLFFRFSYNNSGSNARPKAKDAAGFAGLAALARFGLSQSLLLGVRVE